MTTITDATLFVQLLEIALPPNLTWLEHQYDLPGPKVIMPVGSIEQAIAEADGREMFLFHSHIDGSLQLIAPAVIERVSVARPGDVLKVEAR